MVGSDDEATEVELRRLEEAEEEPLLPEADAERLAALPHAKRAVANRRLAVLRGWHSSKRSELFGNAADAARWAGLSRRGFFDLLKRMEPPRLDGLGLYLERNDARRPATLMTEVAETAAGLLRNDPNMRPTEMVRLLSDGAGAGLSPTTLLRAIDDLRRLAPAAGPFGELIAFDAASMDLVDGAGSRQRLYAAVDVATGLVMGWSIQPDERFAAGYAMASAGIPAFSEIALANLAASAEPLRMEASVTREENATGRKFSDAGWTIVLNRRRIGRRVLAAVGRDVAGVRLAAGFAPPDMIHRSRVPAALPTITPLLIERIGRTMAEHNAVRSRLAPAGDGEGARSRAERFVASVEELRL